MLGLARLLITLIGIVGAVSAAATGEDTVELGPSAHTGPAVFPASVFRHYYNNPTATAAQPQSVVTDPILVHPDHLPHVRPIPPPPPLPAAPSLLCQHAVTQVLSIASNPVFGNDTCTKSQASLEVDKFIAMAAPEEGLALAVALCHHFNFNSDCDTMFGKLGLGGVVTQVVANMMASCGIFTVMLCQNFLSLYPLPPVSPFNLTGCFPKSKPDPLRAPTKPSGKKLKVLHSSDLHLDARYANGAEANCTGGLCCRTNQFNSASPNHTVFPVPRFGAFLWWFDFILFTGDLVAHDPDNQLSRYTVLFDLFKKILGAGPVYAALGNHDSYTQTQNAPHALGHPLASQFSWNYDHVAALWEHEKWIPESAVALARAHYAAYMVRRQDGLRVITLNTDLWYRANYFNMTTHDRSGMLRFLTDELQDAEDILYANNATNIRAETAESVSWVGPSITPLTRLNSGFRLYEVDSSTFDILDAHTWISDVSTTREAHGKNIIEWGPHDPLNATWWHHVIEQVSENPSLITTFNTSQGKTSVMSPD
ncbi:Metallo-dependent phosphatase-like protein [Irpex lacteus]|nr:Metallo-dependent phosphatase-like protein [Irpex lacteus]